MAEQKEPIRFRENCPPSYPPHQHHQHNHHGNQEQSVGGFPNQYFADIHRGRENREKGVAEQGGEGSTLGPFYLGVTNSHGFSSFPYSLSKRSSSSFTAISFVSWNLRARASARTPRSSRTQLRIPGKVARNTCCWPSRFSKGCSSFSTLWRNCGINPFW